MPRTRQAPETRLFPAQLTILIKKNYLSIRQAAKAWGLDHAHVHRLTTGEFVVAAPTVATICENLGNREDRAGLTEAFLADELERLHRDLGIVWTKDPRKAGIFELRTGDPRRAPAP